MVLRIILLTLLLILLILLFAPLCVRLAFDDGDFRWSARYLFLRKSSGAPKHAQHPPEHPEHQKEPAPVKQTAAPTDKPPRTPAADAGKPGQEAAAPEASGKEQEPVQEESAQAETEKKSGGFLSKYKPQSLSEWVELILNLLHAAGRPLRWLLRRITIRDIDLDFTVSHPDAAVCAVRFGKVNIAVYNTLALLCQFFRVRKKQIRIRCIYNQPCGSYRGSCQVRVCPAVILGAAIGLAVRFLYLQHKSNSGA
ncbi:hypothetical protein [Ruminococcus sp.]|uniref:hypothetical protein n=1 Tax=Ruminococcus sp. TaxID=41978 RepID=UPI0025F18E4D|nr:hypothetical protein [Ruminococcus sp.]MCI5815998.1 hypothetical protein [Ruminococcus sp.]